MMLDRCLGFRPEWQAGSNDWNLDISPRVSTATGSISGMAIADCGFRSNLHSSQKVLSLSDHWYRTTPPDVLGTTNKKVWFASFPASAGCTSLCECSQENPSLTYFFSRCPLHPFWPSLPSQGRLMGRSPRLPRGFRILPKSPFPRNR